jgi:acylphosphatase
MRAIIQVSMDENSEKNQIKKHVDLTINGRVQGVFFRHNAKLKADEYGVTGFVKNQNDGSVYIEVEGEEENLDDFLGWCEEGPPYARVNEVQKKESEVKQFSNFEIRN